MESPFPFFSRDSGLFVVMAKDQKVGPRLAELWTITSQKRLMNKWSVSKISGGSTPR